MAKPSVTTTEDPLKYQPRCEPKEVQVLQDTQPESYYVDPTVERTVVNINSPQQADGSVSVKLYIIPKKRTHLTDTVKNWQRTWSSTKTMAASTIKDQSSNPQGPIVAHQDFVQMPEQALMSACIQSRNVIEYLIILKTENLAISTSAIILLAANILPINEDSKSLIMELVDINIPCIIQDEK